MISKTSYTIRIGMNQTKPTYQEQQVRMVVPERMKMQPQPQPLAKEALGVRMVEIPVRTVERY